MTRANGCRQAGRPEAQAAGAASSIAHPPAGSHARLAQVTVGLYHGCSLSAGGDVECFLAYNESLYRQSYDCGQAAVPPGHKWLHVAAGDFGTCGVLANQSVLCWGVSAASNIRRGPRRASRLLMLVVARRLTRPRARFNSTCAVRNPGLITDVPPLQFTFVRAAPRRAAQRHGSRKRGRRGPRRSLSPR